MKTYREIIDAHEDSIFVYDWDSGAIVDMTFHERAEYDHAYDELERTARREAGTGQAPLTAAEARHRFSEAKRGTVQQFEWLRPRQDGTAHWDEVVLQPAVLGGRRCILALARGSAPRRRPEVEKPRPERRLPQARRLEAIGQRTCWIAHDLNNVLVLVIGCLEIALERRDRHDDATLKKYLEQAHGAAQRTRDLVGQLLRFARGKSHDRRPQSPGALVERSMGLLNAAVHPDVELTVDVDPRATIVLADCAQLEQVLVNLVINARDAMKSGGRVELEVKGVDVAAAPCASCRQPVFGRFVQLLVRDSGPGIAPDVAQRMFEPFFTTKTAGTGSGLGLAAVHEVVHEHGGHLLVDTSPSRGTSFRVLLPPLGGEEAPAGEGLRVDGGATQFRPKRACGRGVAKRSASPAEVLATERHAR